MADDNDLNPDAPQRARRGFRLTGKYQRNGWRFLHRRLQHALLRRDTRMIDDTERFQAGPLIAGTIFVIVFGLGCVAAAFFSPNGSLRDGSVYIDSSTGTPYVKVGDQVSPALNMVSAKLIAGSNSAPVKVKRSEIDKSPRGPLVGINGAPGDIVNSASRKSQWTVCDTAATGSAVPLDPKTGVPTTARGPVTTTVIGGALADNDGAQNLTGNSARLAAAGGQTWLVYTVDGETVRSQVDLSDAPTMDALGVSQRDPVVPFSTGLLNAIPARGPLSVSAPAAAGRPVKFSSDGLLVGDVVRSSTVSGEKVFYAASLDGIEQVPATAASVLQAHSKSGQAREVGADKIAAWPKASGQFAVSQFPAERVKIVEPVGTPVTCYSWEHNADDPKASTKVLLARTLPVSEDQSRNAIKFVGAASSEGAMADQAIMPSTPGRFVQITGSGLDAKAREGLYWVGDTGVRFALNTSSAAGNDDTLSALGLSNPVPAPWSIISLFAPGPTLSQSDARKKYDRVPENPYVGVLADPKKVR